jgi:hypothetical protein
MVNTKIITESRAASCSREELEGGLGIYKFLLQRDLVRARRILDEVVDPDVFVGSRGTSCRRDGGGGSLY